ncbi:LacI family transcriptional regulator [Sphingobacterium sp. ML3W]|uniref:LacI family transcriptional regulator n=1 Tax=Sphingobacterium sp. ML3W TaxID=1538644 RepID=UPI00068E1059|nr:LacI family transcriptional regulator [Sphingobacterium sp. ML3W]
MKKITVKEIGLALNKSRSTISKALADSPEISHKTKKMVRNYALTHAFEINSMVKLFKCIENRLIGVILPTIDTPFFSNLLCNFESSLASLGYHLIFMQSKDDLYLELECIERCAINNFAGMVILSTGNNLSRDRLKDLEKNRFPIVVIDEIFRFLDKK